MTLYCASCRQAEEEWQKKNNLQQDSVPKANTRR